MKPQLTAEEREEHKPLTDGELERWVKSDRKVIADYNEDAMAEANMCMRLYATIEKDRKKIAVLEAKLKQHSEVVMDFPYSGCQADGTDR